jgi:hypothetical protein
MSSNTHINLVEPVWRRFARSAGYALVGVGTVMLLIAILTYLHPVLP